MKCASIAVGLTASIGTFAQALRPGPTEADTSRFERDYSGAVFMPQLNFSSAADGRSSLDPVRFTALCFELFTNHDYTPHFGSYFDLGYRQVGYSKELADGSRMKFRTWNMSIGYGLKVGNMQRGLFFGGYRLEWPFNYRERRFEGDDLVGAKSGWISKRTPTFSHVAEFGYQFRFGVALGFDYYLSRFHRPSFTEQVDGQAVQPNAGWDDHVIALSVLLFPFINAYPSNVIAKEQREIQL